LTDVPAAVVVVRFRPKLYSCGRRRRVYTARVRACVYPHEDWPQPKWRTSNHKKKKTKNYIHIFWYIHHIIIIIIGRSTVVGTYILYIYTVLRALFLTRGITILFVVEQYFYFMFTKRNQRVVIIFWRDKRAVQTTIILNINLYSFTFWRRHDYRVIRVSDDIVFYNIANAVSNIIITILYIYYISIVHNTNYK